MGRTMPEIGRFDAARLERIDTFLKERYLDSGRLANAQILIARGGDIAHFSSQGPAREGGKSIDEGSLFRIASMTKPITSIAFMMLLEQGKVALDTPVHHVLPALKGVGVYNGGGGGVPFQTRPTSEPMRMLDLLRHTSGLTYSFQNRSYVDAAYREGKIENWHGNLDLDGFIEAVAKVPLEFSPGEAWNYSVSTDVLGAVVEKVSGQSLADFFRTQIFAPLKMDDTFFAVPEDKIDRLTDCYTFTPEKGRFLYDRGEASAWSRPPKLVSGGGGLVSTALDYHRFCTMLLNGGELDGVRLLSPKSVELMTANHVGGLYQNGSFGFGLGFEIVEHVGRAGRLGSPGAYGWGSAYYSVYQVDPQERLVAIFLTQLIPAGSLDLRDRFRALVYQAIVGPPR